MPALETIGEHWNDLSAVKSAMHWPAVDSEGEKRRVQYRVAEYVNRVAFEPGTEKLALPVDALQTLLFTPSWPTLTREVAQTTRLGIQAGEVLLSMFFMDRLQDRLPARGARGASLDKAFWIASAWAGQGAAWGDGVPMDKSTTKIKEAWSKYRGVAHLWAALRLNLVHPYAPARQVFDAAYFPRFLETAAFLQRFALEHKLMNRAKQGVTPLVAASEMWQLDLQVHRPREFPAELADDARIFDLLKRYASDKQ